MEIVYSIISVLVGLAVGGFLNVCIDRLPRGESILNLPSHCWSGRILGVELASGVIFAFLYQHYGLSAELGIMAFYTGIFIIIFVIDLEHGLILNKVVYPGMIFALILAVFLSLPWLGDCPLHGIANAGIGGSIGFALFLFLALISHGGIGWGDVKLAALIGFATGFPLVLVALIIGAILGGVAAVILLAMRKRGRHETIPFGPFLSLAAMVTLLWGNDILHWYLGLL